MSVTLSAKLPLDDRNGMGAISAALCDNPDARHIIVAVVSCKQITTDVDSGAVVPQARILAVEAFHGGTDDAKELRRIWRRAYELRTGKAELPIDGQDGAA